MQPVSHDEAMSEPLADQPDRRRVRLGLALISVVVVVAVVMFFVVPEAPGKALMLVIAVIAVVRMYMLARWLRSGAGGS
jgi:hypothetical protein